jgi:uncharacterized protein YkwD
MINADMPTHRAEVDEVRVQKAAPRGERPLSAWLGLAALAALGWGCFAPAPSSAQTERPADHITTIQLRALELVNQSRQQHGLPPLMLEDKLSAAAQAHADDMFTRRYYDHDSPEGTTAHDRYIEAGGSRWRLVAENIGLCTGCRPPRRVPVLNRLHQTWLDSPGHRENILRKGLTHFGFGMVVDEERRLYAVQTFAGPGLPRGSQDEEPAPLSAEEQARQALQQFNLAREHSGVALLELSEALNDVVRATLPDRGLEDFDLGSQKDSLDALLRSERGSWQSFSVMAVDCGGCGTVPTAADIRYFVRHWLEDPSYKRDLLDARVTHVGFSVATNGEGMKVALAVLGWGGESRSGDRSGAAAFR